MLSDIPNDTFDKAAFDGIHAIAYKMAIAACFIAEAYTNVPFFCLNCHYFYTEFK